MTYIFSAEIYEVINNQKNTIVAIQIQIVITAT